VDLKGRDLAVDVKLDLMIVKENRSERRDCRVDCYRIVVSNYQIAVSLVVDESERQMESWSLI
jgi:hypothetical protein